MAGMTEAAATQALEDWLAACGLAHLTPQFRQHAIDLDILPDLTADDLAEIGIPLGDRKRLLKAIAAPGTAASTTPPLPPPSATAAERRQITVLFCDLVGSSRLTASLDPEESRNIIRKYRGVVAEEVERLGGHIAQYLGDGVLAYFGWPQALENAAHRAVAAGLAIIEAVEQQASLQRHKLQVRLGIATGLVVVGASDTPDGTEDMTAVGDVVNIAARLQEFAPASGIAIAASTASLVAAQFELVTQGAKRLKGIAETVEVFQVERQSAMQRRRHTSHVNMLGREGEMRLALGRWDLACSGEGQVVLITGEPGIGKSYMTDNLVAAIAAAGTSPLRFDCSPFQQSTALYPIIEDLRFTAGMLDNEEPARQVEKLLTHVRGFASDPEEAMSCLCRLLLLPSENWPEPEGTTPMIRKAHTFAALTQYVLSRLRQGPVLAVLEDAHWADPTTLEFFEQLIEACRSEPVLLLVNGRPDFRPQWHERGSLTAIALQKLPRLEVERVIAAVCMDRALPRPVVSSIIDRSDGIPLFIEELTKAVLESLAGGKSAAADIPLSLRDTLMTRLDRRPEAREVAQFAACIGRECDHEMLAAISGKTESQLDDALSKLAKDGILFRSGIAPQATYRFKHALVQEAAADTLLKSKRRDIHARIAQHMQTHRPEFAAARPELLAYHFTQAQEYAVAIGYHQQAGNQAVAASGNLEAIEEFGHALELITLLPPSEQRDKLELEILIAQAIPYTLTKGYAAPEVEAVYKRAMETSGRLPQEAQSFAVIYGFWRFYLLRGDYANALTLSRQLLAIADAHTDPAMLVTSNRAAGSTRFYVARFQEGLQHMGRMASVQPDESLRKAILSYDVVDPWVVNTAYSGMALWIHGYPAQAIEHNDRAIALARQVNHPFTLALALCFAQWTHQFQRDRQRVHALSTEALELSNKYGFTFWKGWAEMLMAWAESGSDSATARKRMKSALQLWQSTGSQLGLSYFQCLLAEQCDGVEARLMLDAAEKFANEREEFFWLPEIYRVTGHHALREGYDNAAAKAEGSFRAALASAEKLAARGHALRAALDLAKLRGANAAELQVLRRCAEGFGAADSFDDLAEVRRLLSATAV